VWKFPPYKNNEELDYIKAKHIYFTSAFCGEKKLITAKEPFTKKTTTLQNTSVVIKLIKI